MSGSVDEAVRKANERYRRRGRAEIAFTLRLEGWSHRFAMAVYEDHLAKHRHHAEVEEELSQAAAILAVQEVSGGHRGLTLHECGIVPPTSDRKSKRKRGDAPTRLPLVNRLYLST